MESMDGLESEACQPVTSPAPLLSLSSSSLTQAPTDRLWLAGRSGPTRRYGGQNAPGDRDLRPGAGILLLTVMGRPHFTGREPTFRLL